MNHFSKEKLRKTFTLQGKNYHYYDIEALSDYGFEIHRLPYTIKILLEAVVRQCDEYSITSEHIKDLANWAAMKFDQAEVPFKPARVILQDFTGVPAVVDLASMREAMREYVLTNSPDLHSPLFSNTKEKAFQHSYLEKINPEVPVDLIIDHSVQVDCYGSEKALYENMDLEFERNIERYQFLNWAKGAFHNFNVVPPATGIVHQVNLEYLAQIVRCNEEEGDLLAFPDTLVGTDSHTTMINGLGVLGWGVGGIEAEAGMLGQPSFFPVPEVIGVRINGTLPVGVTATDLALRVTKLLRSRGVVGKFVEFYGEGVATLSLADRATVANMAPEYGATCGFFPVDEETLQYLRLTGRSEEQIELVETYLRKNGMFHSYEQQDIIYSQVIELDLATVETSLSGPKRPQDLIPLTLMKREFETSVTATMGNQGHGLPKEEFQKEVEVRLPDGRRSVMRTGAVVIASITSCTNTSNPYVMLGAGLLAKNAVEKGLKVPAHVKTSLAPGSKVVTAYLKKAGLQNYFDELGFQTVGYGCATCIGNSGPLLPEITSAITENDLLVSSVLSGNRNFEGRIHSLVKANYLASPLLVVAYALAGTVDIDLYEDPIGYDTNGKKIYLKDIWPSSHEINCLIKESVTADLYVEEYRGVYSNNENWNAIASDTKPLYDFDESSTYIQNPTYFTELSMEITHIKALSNLRVIGKFGDSITTDHISPAGSIGKSTPAAKYLIEHGVDPNDFNTYGARRGNHEVMMRGTFANIRIRNLLAPGTEGGYTTYFPEDRIMSIYDACMKYKEDGVGLVVLAGKDYGMGSSRDWAAKGPSLLGVKAVIAESYERIHRSNLVMMGILPLQYIEGQTAEILGLTGREIIEIQIDDSIKPRGRIKVRAIKEEGAIMEFQVRVRFDSQVEVDYYRHGGILPMVLRQKIRAI
ncbi:MAG: acnA [Herbinix sp.]|jgi:aconitate hydratase|nr:acnA [Herbinix sp.]